MNAIFKALIGFGSNLTFKKVLWGGLAIIFASMIIYIFSLKINLGLKENEIKSQAVTITAKDNIITQKDKDISNLKVINDDNSKQLKTLESVVKSQQETQKRLEELSTKLTKVKNHLDKSIDDLNYSQSEVNYQYLTSDENQILINLSKETTN